VASLKDYTHLQFGKKSILICLKRTVFMRDDLFFMELAYKQALIAQKNNEVPVGAVAVLDNEVIAKAYNKKETKKNPTRHAEMELIDKCCKKLQSKYLSEVTFYVTLEPCVMCAGALVHARIKRLVYGSTDSKFGGIESVIVLQNVKKNHVFEIEKGILGEKCTKVLKEFFYEKRI
jgi:tRNA(Arg) A34 adenosine deaminase TadA